MNYIGETFYTETELRKIKFKHLGENVQIKRNVGMYFCENISLHDNVRIDDYAVIVGTGAGLVIGRNVHFSARAYLVCFGGIVIGKFNLWAKCLDFLHVR